MRQFVVDTFGDAVEVENGFWCIASEVKAELASLQAENAALKEQLAKLEGEQEGCWTPHILSEGSREQYNDTCRHASTITEAVAAAVLALIEKEKE